MSEVRTLASELIRRVSVTPDDAGCQRLVAERLLRSGCEVEWFLCGEVSNVLITHGRGSPSLWLLGHTDVVPPGPEKNWSAPPFEPTERDDCLYGRGACDMKGAVAAMVVALEQFIAGSPGHAGQVGVLLTSDEEGVAVDGIRRVAETLRSRGVHPDACLVGEPSSLARLGDMVRIGRRGSIAATLEVRGRQGHTAFPESIDNPLHRLAPLLADLVARRWDEGVADDEGSFPPTHCQVSSLTAGTGAVNVTPDAARLTISFRYNTQWTADTLRTEFEAMLAGHGVTDYTLDWWVSGEPFRSAAGPLRAAVTDTLREQLDIEPDLNTGGGTSDGRFIAPLGSEVVELGLINATIHQVDEHVALADLDALADIYTGVLTRFTTA